MIITKLQINSLKINLNLILNLNLAILAFNKSSFHNSLDSFCNLLMKEVRVATRDQII